MHGIVLSNTRSFDSNLRFLLLLTPLKEASQCPYLLQYQQRVRRERPSTGNSGAIYPVLYEDDDGLPTGAGPG
jgi:hypothetical protein